MLNENYTQFEFQFVNTGPGHWHCVMCAFGIITHTYV